MRFSHITLPSLCGLLLAVACQSSDFVPKSTIAREHLARSLPVDAEHYFLDLKLLPERRAIEGRARVRFVAREAGVTSVTLDLEGLTVSAVRGSDGEQLVFVQRAGQVICSLGRELDEGEAFTVELDYGGKPVKGLWFVENSEGEVYQVFTQGECLDSRGWFPCFDFPAERATSELRVELPRHWISVAAGSRIDSGETPDGRFEHWRMNTPHPAYLTTLCAGELHAIEGEWDGIPLSFYADESYAEWMPFSFEETDEILAFLSHATGRRYPYPKYAQACVANFPFGGMENISATTLTETTLSDSLGQRDRDSHGLVAHEAAHQWFGDLLTCADWSHIWLNEGFATYFTQLYFEESRGLDEFRARMRDTQSSYTEADRGQNRRPTVHAIYRDPFDLFFGGQTYAGGACRLHYLRFILGDEGFFAGIRRYVADNEGRAVVTADLRRAMETASGRDLTTFFEQWFYQAGYPELNVDWSWDAARKLVLLEVEQVQEPKRGTPRVFDLEVDVELRLGKTRQVLRLVLDERSEEFEIAAASAPTWVRFDKHGWLPARTASRKSGTEWVAIAAEDDDVNGRRDAAHALGRMLLAVEDSESRRLYLSSLVSRLRDDSQPAVRRAAVEALAKMPAAVAAPHLEQAARKDENAGVRAAALRGMAGFGASPERAALAHEVYAEGYSWDVKIAAAGLLAAASPKTARKWLLERFDEPSPHGRLMAGLVRVLSGLESEIVIADVKTVLADSGAPDSAREAAADALGRRARYDREVRDLLFALLDENSHRLRQSAIKNLGRLRDTSAIPRLRRELAQSAHSPERRNIEKALKQLDR
ncbi:MAG: M1 family aminopeptidase [bacterium]